MVDQVVKGNIPKKSLLQRMKENITNYFKKEEEPLNKEADKRRILSPSEQQRLNRELISAIENRNIEKVKSLLKAGADVNAKDENEWTALMLAAADGYIEVIKELLASGANPLLLVTLKRANIPWGSRASDVAKTEEIRKLIKEYEIKWLEKLLGERGAELHSAIKDCKPDDVKRIFSSL